MGIADPIPDRISWKKVSGLNQFYSFYPQNTTISYDIGNTSNYDLRRNDSDKMIIVKDFLIRCDEITTDIWRWYIYFHNLTIISKVSILVKPKLKTDAVLLKLSISGVQSYERK